MDALTFESDFAPFLKPEVDPATQRAALKKLFSDPRFNVMDGLDTYIDDYTQADPMPAGMLDKLANVYAMLTKDAQRSDAQSVSAEEDHPAPAATGDPQAIEAAPPAADVPAPVRRSRSPRQRTLAEMSVVGKTLFVCNCNRTMPLDGEALGRALALPSAPKVHTMLCQRELDQYAAGATGDLLVACTQEQRLLGEVAEEGGKAQQIRFVNIRETGGWSAEAGMATPKIAALLAMAALPDPDPVPSVGYKSDGQLLITGPLDAALGWADALHGPAGGDGARHRPRRSVRRFRSSAPSRSTPDA